MPSVQHIYFQLKPVGHNMKGSLTESTTVYILSCYNLLYDHHLQVYSVILQGRTDNLKTFSFGAFAALVSLLQSSHITKRKNLFCDLLEIHNPFGFYLYLYFCFLTFDMSKIHRLYHSLGPMVTWAQKWYTPHITLLLSQSSAWLPLPTFILTSHFLSLYIPSNSDLPCNHWLIVLPCSPLTAFISRTTNTHSILSTLQPWFLFFSILCDHWTWPCFLPLTHPLCLAPKVSYLDTLSTVPY